MNENKPQQILIVEDDSFVRKALATYLETEGYIVTSAKDGVSMYEAMKENPADLVIMDLKLPGEDGLTLTKHLRNNYDVGIIILTARDATLDRVVGLEIGADDYVTKPFEERELLARIRSVLRRVNEKRKAVSSGDAPATNSKAFHFNGWTFNIDTRTLTDAQEKVVELTSSEFSLLAELIQNAQNILSRDHLLKSVYNREWEPYDRSIDVLVTRVRQKIEKNTKSPQLIKTVRGKGYVFTCELE